MGGPVVQQTVEVRRSPERRWLSTLIWVLLPFLAALIGSLFTAPAIPGWYAELSKPDFTPPSSVFGPVWSFLYLIMGISAAIVWRHSWWDSLIHPLSFFIGQLILNTLWPILFFGFHLLGAALVEIVVLLILIAITTAGFFRVHWLAGVLMLPYLGWACFATLLNWEFWRLN